MRINDKLLRILPDQLYIDLMYYYHFHKFPDLRNPKTFNEKLQWLKLHDKRPEYSTMVDKVLVKDYIANKVGQEYVIPTLATWERAEDIDLSILPDEFVLKCNHDSQSVKICRDKNAIKLDEIKTYYAKRLNNNGFWYGREWPYKNVRPRILAEKFMSDDSGDSLTDYKIHCFNGIPRAILVCQNRGDRDRFTECFYDTEWNEIDVSRPGTKKGAPVLRPAQLDKMLTISKTLSDTIPFVRVDFYIISGKAYVGEITFFPASGFKQFAPKDADEMMGSWLNIESV